MSEPTALDSAASRRPAVIVYFLCCALVVALLPLNGRIRWSEVGPALVLQALAGAVLAAGSRLPSDRYPAVGVVAVIAYLSSVALLQDGVDPASGFGTLVLLPVVWASLRARRIELTIAVAGVALIYIAPALLIGPPKYPAGTWRAGLLFTVISVGLGASVLNLTGRVHALVGQLAELARTDELTGIPNRRAWQELLDHELSIFRRNGRPFAIVMLDLDHFKSYNDTHGHPAGDRLLREMAAAWGSALREPDVLARWGGDEFVVLLPACDASRSAGVLERLRTACPEAPFSAGLAQSEPGSTAESMLAAADAALYTSKRAGRPDVSFVPAVPLRDNSVVSP
ncbi:MAG: GGDEF domain-containing protein [Solirubrobacteraceae bacterium]